jgi:hypothetical protein
MEGKDLTTEINNISKSKILGSSNFDEIIFEISSRICKCLQIERVNIWLYNEERDVLRAIGEVSD